MADFASVKLPADLVDQARASAQTMRRSVAGQIEYWATLGRSLEAAGLTAQDTSALIARQDASVYSIKKAAATASADAAEMEGLTSHVRALAKSGALAQRASAEVAANAAKALHPKTRSRKAA